MHILVTGASGFVGRRLVPALIDEGHEVRAMTRRPEAYDGDGEAVGADVSEPETLTRALDGIDVAYYLIHSLDHRDFVRRDARAAEAFGRAAAKAGVRRINYLSGLGEADDDLSDHLKSRQECEGLLADAGVPVSSLRAGIVIGHGGASWEIVHNLVETFPALVVPQWGRTLTQPISLSDMVRYLVGVLSIDDDTTYTFEVGGADVMPYVDMLTRVSSIEGRHSLFVPVWIPSSKLAALVAGQALPFVTKVNGRTIRTLIESMKNEVVVHDDMIKQVVPFEPMGYDDAVLEAMAERARERRAAG